MKTVGLLILLASSIAAASDVRIVHVPPDIDFAIPASSPVTSWKIKEYGVVEYTGKFIVSGSYEYGWLTDDPTDADNYGFKSLTFTVDPEYTNTFPYWTRDGIQRRDFIIRNPNAFARAVIPKNQLKLLDLRKIKSITGRTSVWVRSLRTSVECDHQINSALFISTVKSNAISKLEFSDSQGC